MNKRLSPQLFAFLFILLTSLGFSQKVHAQSGPENCDSTKYFCRLLTPGSKGEDVVRLKQYLKKAGKFANDITSDNYNGLVKLRVSELQLVYGLTPTGNLNSLIRAIINASIGDTAEKSSNSVVLGEYKDLITTTVKLNASHTLVGPNAKTAWFEYAENEQSLNSGTGFYTQHETLNPDQKDFGAQLTGLKKGAFYWYRAVVSDGGVLYKSNIASLKMKQGVISSGGGSSHNNTPPPQPSYVAPTTSLVGVTNITSSSADISVDYVINGGLATTLTYTVGTNQLLNAGNEIIITHSVSNASGTDIANLSNLSSSSTYYFTVTAVNSSGAASVITGTFATGIQIPSYLSQYGITGIMKKPAGIISSVSGMTYVVDRGSHSHYKFDSNNALVSSLGTQGIATSQFDLPSDVALDELTADVYFYVADTANGRIQKFTDSGSFVIEFGQTLLKSPSGIDIDQSGNIYVADYGVNLVLKFDSSGNFISSFGTTGTGPGQFTKPIDVALDSSGILYVLDNTASKIMLFDTNNNYAYVDEFGSLGVNTSQFKTPSSIAFDSNGDLFVVDSGNDRIQKFDSSHNFIYQFGQTGSGNGQFNYPYGITILINGLIHITDHINARIQIFQ